MTRRLLHAALDAFLAFSSSSAVWALCIAIPILSAMVFMLVPFILLAIWAAIAGEPIGDAAFENVVIAVILLVMVAFIPPVSRAIVRLSLRLNPLPVGRMAGLQLAPILWLSWLGVYGLLAAGGSERITLLVAVVVVGFGMGRTYLFRRRWRGFPRGRTVLFLRRFGKTADRAVSTALRRAVPAGACLAFLVGPRQNAASWDPLVVAFDGIRARGLPHYLQSTDHEWVGHVREMVLHADAVVLDATDWSDALDTELAVVDSCDASSRLIVLVRQGHPEQDVLRGRHQLRYRVSWRQAGHRIFWGGLLTLVPAVAGESIGWSVNTRILMTIPAVVAWLLLAVRPLMDESATDELAGWLGGIEPRAAR